MKTDNDDGRQSHDRPLPLQPKHFPCQKDLNHEKHCILCLRDNTTENTLISTPTPMEKIKEPAKIRSDESVMNRAESCETFSYHMDNKCNKTCTMSTTLESVARKRKQSETVEQGESSLTVPDDILPYIKRTTCNKEQNRIISTCSPQITKKEQLYEIKCTICNNVKLYG